MNTMETICQKKSVRNYTGENITNEELSTTLKAANASPVGMEQFDSLHLTVITNKELKLPEGFIPCCAICLGKTDEKYELKEIPANRIAQTTIL